jgi:hypothetical protein
MQARVVAHLTSVAFSTLNANRERVPAHRDPVTHVVTWESKDSTLSDLECAEILWAYAVEVGGHSMVISDDELHPLASRMTTEKMWTICQRAATFARERWDANWMSEMKRRAALGGENSVRRPSITVEDVRGLLGLTEGLPERNWASTIAKELKCSPRTVKRRLVELATLNSGDDDGDAAVDATEVVEGAASLQLDLVSSLTEQVARVRVGVGVLRDDDLTDGMEGNVDLNCGHVPTVLTSPDPLVAAALDTLELDLYAYIERMQEEKKSQVVPALQALVDGLELDNLSAASRAA